MRRWIALRGLEGVPIHGPNMEASRLTVRAGIGALEGRHDEALGAYREALGLWRDLGLVWDEALCGLDVAMLMGVRDDEALATVERTRNLLTQAWRTALPGAAGGRAWDGISHESHHARTGHRTLRA